MNITVYCGVSIGTDPAFEQAARDLGTWIGLHGHTLVYGGGGIGMMGALSDAVLDSGGSVLGVIPQFLIDREQINPHLANPVVVDTMAQRKAIMIEQGDAFVMLPGGIGTFEEITEVLSDKKLGFLPEPVFIANINGCYDSFIQSLEDLMANGFLLEGESSFTAVASVEDLVAGLEKQVRP